MLAEAIPEPSRSISMGNNYCALRNVTLQSSDPSHSGAIGLALLRYAAGPCLMKNMVINGFDYGIKVANNEYSVTFEDLTLLNQKLYGIYNASNVLSIRHLFSTNRVPAIYNANTAGLVTLVGAILRGRFFPIFSNSKSGNALRERRYFIGICFRIARPGFCDHRIRFWTGGQPVRRQSFVVEPSGRGDAAL